MNRDDWEHWVLVRFREQKEDEAWVYELNYRTEDIEGYVRKMGYHHLEVLRSFDDMHEATEHLIISLNHELARLGAIVNKCRDEMVRMQTQRFAQQAEVTTAVAELGRMVRKLLKDVED